MAQQSTLDKHLLVFTHIKHTLKKNTLSFCNVLKNSR